MEQSDTKANPKLTENKCIDIMNTKERDHWCTQLGCSVKDLVIAEYKVGSNIEDIKNCLSKQHG